MNSPKSTITPLLANFEAAASRSMTDGHPPFADILTQIAQLDGAGQWNALVSLSNVWMESGVYSAVAAKQFSTLLSQDWLQNSHALLLINAGQKLILTNQLAGNTAAVDEMKEAIKRFPMMARAIESNIARKMVVVPEILAA